MTLLGLFLLLLQVAPAAVPGGLPGSPGIYYQNAGGTWVAIPKATISHSKLTGTGLFVETGGYTNLGTDVVCAGAKASTRISGPRPMLYVQGVGSPEDVILIRLTQRKATRTFYKSSANSTLENKVGANRSDIRRTTVTVLADGTFSIKPDVDLKPGEYLLVIGDPENSYDFGIDPDKK